MKSQIMRDWKAVRWLRSRWLMVTGIVLTVLWVVLGLILYFEATDDTVSMRPNELGDLLSGFVAPLAVIWLVIGMFMQAQALRFQQEELKHQIEETRNLVASNRDQVQLSRTSIDLAQKRLDLDHRNEERLKTPYLKFTPIHHANPREFEVRNLGDQFEFQQVAASNSKVDVRLDWNPVSPIGRLTVRSPNEFVPPHDTLYLHFLYRNATGDFKVLYYGLDWNTCEIVATDSEGWEK